MLPAQKRTLLILFAAFVMAAGVNSFMVVLLASNTSAGQPADVHAIAPILYCAAAFVLAASMYIAMTRMVAALDYSRFVTQMILALALAEACTILGMLLFFLSHKPELYWPFPALTVATELLIILPRVLQR